MFSKLMCKIKNFFKKKVQIEHYEKDDHKLILDSISSINNDFIALKLDIEKELEIHIMECVVAEAKENNMLN